jgi:DNA-binding MarR family transcriptional regulator
VQASSVTTQASEKALTRRLAHFVGYVQQTFGRDVVQLSHEFEISFSQMKALQILRLAGEPTSIKDLGDRLGLSLGAMSRAADGLVQRGLVDRLEDPEDRRIKRLSLTKPGQEFVEKLIEVRLAGISDFVASLSPKEQALLAKALDPIMERADIVAYCGGPK